MGSERNKYVMSVELAMRREIAYREKLQRLAMEQGPSIGNTTTSREKPLFPSQVPKPITSTQSPSSLPMPTPNPQPQPHPTPKPFPNPRSRPDFGPPPIPTSGPTHSTADHNRKRKERVDFFCNICQVDCTSELNLRMHLRGHKHKAKLKEKGKGGMGNTTYVGGVTIGAIKPTKKPFCELCGIFCTDEFSFRQHLVGKNHTLKVVANEKRDKGPYGGIPVPQIAWKPT